MKPLNYNEPIQERKEVVIPSNPTVANGTDWLTWIIAMLGALKLVLAVDPINIQIPNETFDAIVNFISVAAVGFGIHKKTYLTNKEKKQKSVIEQAGLK